MSRLLVKIVLSAYRLILQFFILGFFKCVEMKYCLRKCISLRILRVYFMNAGERETCLQHCTKQNFPRLGKHIYTVP